MAFIDIRAMHQQHLVTAWDLLYDANTTVLYYTTALVTSTATK